MHSFRSCTQVINTYIQISYKIYIHVNIKLYVHKYQIKHIYMLILNYLYINKQIILVMKSWYTNTMILPITKEIMVHIPQTYGQSLPAHPYLVQPMRWGLSLAAVADPHLI